MKWTGLVGLHASEVGMAPRSYPVEPSLEVLLEHHAEAIAKLKEACKEELARAQVQPHANTEICPMAWDLDANIFCNYVMYVGFVMVGI